MRQVRLYLNCPKCGEPVFLATHSFNGNETEINLTELDLIYDNCTHCKIEFLVEINTSIPSEEM